MLNFAMIEILWCFFFFRSRSRKKKCQKAKLQNIPCFCKWWWFGKSICICSISFFLFFISVKWYKGVPRKSRLQTVSIERIWGLNRTVWLHGGLRTSTNSYSTYCKFKADCRLSVTPPPLSMVNTIHEGKVFMAEMLILHMFYTLSCNT